MKKFLLLLLVPFLFFFMALLFVVVDEDLFTTERNRNSAVHSGLWETDVIEYLDRFDVNYGEGQGLNILLIANIPNECYVKELLNMYSNYTNGNLTSNTSNVHLSVGGLLGLQCNETGWYDNAHALPKSWLPWDATNNRVIWNEPYSTFSAADMTLGSVNSNMVNITYNNPVPSKIPYNVNGMASAPGTVGERDIGPFQINKNVFGVYNGSDTNNTCKSRNGYGISGTGDRLSDIFYLPDVLQYFDNRIDEISACFLPVDFGSMNSKVIDCMYSRYHNGGAGSFMYGTFGLNSSGSGISVGSSTMRKYSSEAKYVWTFVEGMAESLKDLAGYDKVQQLIYDQRNQKIISGYLAIKNDFILSRTAFNTFFSDDQISNNVNNAINCTGRQTAYVVGLLEGKDFANANEVSDTYIKQVRERFLKCVRSLDGTGYPTSVGYTDSSINSNVYGTVVKVFDQKCDVYGNSNSNLSFAMNLVHFGHMLSTCVAGDIQYAVTLKYAGVDVDPTNPSTYFQQYKDKEEWTPTTKVDFLQTYDVDTSELSELRLKVLEYANTYNDGNHPYWLGGSGIVLSESTYSTLYSKRTLSSGNQSRASKVFARNADGSFVYEGIEMFDCSSFVHHVFMQTVGFDLPAYSGSLLTTNKLEELPNKAEAKAGDLMVMQGHTGILLKYDASTGKFILLEQTPECIQILSHTLGKGAYSGKVGFYRPKIAGY